MEDDRPRSCRPIDTPPWIYTEIYATGVLDMGILHGTCKLVFDWDILCMVLTGTSKSRSTSKRSLCNQFGEGK